MTTGIFNINAGGECPVSRPGCFIPGEAAPGAFWTEGCVGFRADLDAVGMT